MISAADERAGDQRDEHRGTDGAAEEQPSTAASLMSPIAHPARVREHGDEEEAAGGDAGDQVLDERVGLESAARAPGPRPRRSSISLLGMIRWSRSISVTGTSSSTNASAEQRVLVGALGEHDERRTAAPWPASTSG